MFKACSQFVQFRVNIGGTKLCPKCLPSRTVECLHVTPARFTFTISWRRISTVDYICNTDQFWIDSTDVGCSRTIGVWNSFPEEGILLLSSDCAGLLWLTQGGIDVTVQ